MELKEGINDRAEGDSDATGTVEGVVPSSCSQLSKEKVEDMVYGKVGAADGYSKE